MSLSIDGAKGRCREEGGGSWDEMAFDGAVLREQMWIKNNQEAYPQGRVKKQTDFVYASNVEYRPLVLFYRPLHPRFRPPPVDAFVVTSRRAIIQDRSCVEVECHALAMRFWIDPEADYLIRRMTIGKTGSVMGHFDIEYEGEGGRAIPSSWTYKQTDGAGELWSSEAATKVSISHGQTDPAGFTLQFLPGAYVFDDRDGRAYILREDGSERPVRVAERKFSYSELAKSNPGDLASLPPTPFFSSTTGLLLICVAACLALLLAYRCWVRLHKPINA